MEILGYLQRAMKMSLNVIRFGASIQGPARQRLAKDLAQICSDAQDGYATVLQRLAPVKQTLATPDQLAPALRSLAADAGTRASFKPDHLCGRVDQLMLDIQSNLHPLKYSVSVDRIAELKLAFAQITQYDNMIYDAYNKFTRGLDDLALAIETTLPSDPAGAKKVAAEAAELISTFEEELSDSIRQMADLKTKALGV